METRRHLQLLAAPAAWSLVAVALPATQWWTICAIGGGLAANFVLAASYGVAGCWAVLGAFVWTGLRKRLRRAKAGVLPTALHLLVVPSLAVGTFLAWEPLVRHGLDPWPSPERREALLNAHEEDWSEYADLALARYEATGELRSAASSPDARLESYRRRLGASYELAGNRNHVHFVLGGCWAGTASLSVGLCRTHDADFLVVSDLEGEEVPVRGWAHQHVRGSWYLYSSRSKL